MDVPTFLRDVAERTGVDRADARDAATAVLATLSEHLTNDEAGNLRSQLPEELQLPLLRGAAEHFDFDEMVRRVAARDPEKGINARFVAEGVLEALRDAVDAGTWEHLLAQLPTSFPPKADEELQKRIAGRTSRVPWRPTARPGEWEAITDSDEHGVVRAVAGEFEGRVCHGANVVNGPRVFDDPDDVLAYVEANLGVPR